MEATFLEPALHARADELLVESIERDGGRAFDGEHELDVRLLHHALREEPLARLELVLGEERGLAIVARGRERHSASGAQLLDGDLDLLAGSSLDADGAVPPRYGDGARGARRRLRSLCGEQLDAAAHHERAKERVPLDHVRARVDDRLRRACAVELAERDDLGIHEPVVVGELRGALKRDRKRLGIELEERFDAALGKALRGVDEKGPNRCGVLRDVLHVARRIERPIPNTARDTPDDSLFDLRGERVREVLLRQDAELDDDLAEAHVLVVDDGVGHLADDGGKLLVGDDLLADEDVPERLPEHTGLGEHGTPRSTKMRVSTPSARKSSAPVFFSRSSVRSASTMSLRPLFSAITLQEGSRAAEAPK